MSYLGKSLCLRCSAFAATRSRWIFFLCLLTSATTAWFFSILSASKSISFCAPFGSHHEPIARYLKLSAYCCLKYLSSMQQSRLRPGGARECFHSLSRPRFALQSVVGRSRTDSPKHHRRLVPTHRHRFKGPDCKQDRAFARTLGQYV